MRAGRGTLRGMTKLVLLHKAGSIYDDEPDRRYDFPRPYLKAVTAGVGDWVVYYEPVKAGPRGYFAVARIAGIAPKPGVSGRFLALIRPGSYLPFDREVPRLIDGRPLESALAGADGTPKSGGAQQLAVRRLPESEFAEIVRRGLPVDLIAQEDRMYDTRREADDAPAPFERPVIERLTNRAYRDIAFRRKVRAAYDDRCAMSGLMLRNGGGRPEVQAAHIRPVAHQGSNSVRNGLALSGTLHWMFDRGLLSVADDGSILVSRNKVPGDVCDRLINPTGKLLPPVDARDAPHPANLTWHRENIYGQVAPDGPMPWG
jgi:putative restriction endonuclease